MAEALPNPMEAWARAFRSWSESMGAALPALPGVPAADGAAADPFTLWQKTYDQWVSGLTEAMEQNLSKPETAAAGGQMLDAMLNVEKPLREQTAATMQLWLEFMNMPSRRDLLRALVALNDANQRIDELQTQVEDLHDKIDQLLARDSGTPVRAGAKGGAI